MGGEHAMFENKCCSAVLRKQLYTCITVWWACCLWALKSQGLPAWHESMILGHASPVAHLHRKDG
jgi:hypothetical protein